RRRGSCGFGGRVAFVLVGVLFVWFVRAGRGHAGRRPAAALLHLGDHGAAQAGRAHAGQLPGGAPVHHVLGRHPAGRRAPEPVLAGLGQARVEQRVRAVERGRDRASAELPAVLGVVAAGRARFVPGPGTNRARPAATTPRTAGSSALARSRPRSTARTRCSTRAWPSPARTGSGARRPAGCRPSTWWTGAPPGS